MKQTLWEKLSPKKQELIEKFRNEYPASVDCLMHDLQQNIVLGELDFQQIIWLTHILDSPDKASELEIQVENLFE